MHDGEDNSCLVSDHYIMIPTAGGLALNFTNMYKFSPCSIREIYDRLSRPSRYFTAILHLFCSLCSSNKFEPQCSCWLEAECFQCSRCVLTTSGQYDLAAFTQYLRELPGQKYDVFEQCKAIFGEQSFFCGVSTPSMLV